MVNQERVFRSRISYWYIYSPFDDFRLPVVNFNWHLPYPTGSNNLFLSLASPMLFPEVLNTFSWRWCYLRPQGRSELSWTVGILLGPDMDCLQCEGGGTKRCTYCLFRVNKSNRWSEVVINQETQYLPIDSSELTVQVSDLQRDGCSAIRRSESERLPLRFMRPFLIYFTYNGQVRTYV